MADNTRKCVQLLLLTIATVYVAEAYDIIEAPVHTAALVGTEAHFNYSATYTSGTDSIKWGFYDESLGSPTLRTIYTDAQGITSDAAPYYDVDDSMADQYDMMVLNVEEKLAGKYYAGFAIDDTVKVEPYLVVLWDWQCTPPGTVVDEGTYINYDCMVTYKGYKAPRLRWMDQDGNEVIGHWHEDETTHMITYTANVTADHTFDRHVMTCHLDFVQDAEETEPAPIFTGECETHYQVTYHTNMVEIHPDPDSGTVTMYEGEEINCTGNGNPEPTDYSWYCGGVYHSQGQILPITGDLVNEDTMNNCNCSVRNNVDGVLMGWSKTIGFYAYPDPNADTGGGTASAGVIAAAVIIPLVLVGVAVAVGLYFFMKKRKQNEKSSHKNGTTPSGKPLQPTHMTSAAPKPQGQSSAPKPEPMPRGGGGPSQHGEDPRGGGGAYPREEPRGGSRYGGPPPGAQPTPFTTSQRYPGKGSPGFADLGQKSLHSSVPRLNQSQESISSLQDPRFYQPGQTVNHNPSGSQV